MNFEISELDVSAELLPKREALGIGGLNVGVLTAHNAATAVGIGGDATAVANQDIDVSQKG